MFTLAMMVRNEAACLLRCLGSLRPSLSSWVIVDTGSTDGTQDLVQELLGGIPGRLEERPWINFGHNRSELIRLAEEDCRGIGILTLDADMTVQAGPELSLSADAGMVLVEDGSLCYRLPLLLRPGLPWRYHGAVHEYLDCDRGYTRGEVSNLVVTHHADGGSRAAKFLRDRDLLGQSDLNDPRNVFYLAQTERCLGNDQEALALFRRRSVMGGWEEEGWYAAYQAALILLRYSPSEGTSALWQAWERRPWRAEPLYDLARHHRERKLYQAAGMFAEQGMRIPFPRHEVLFVHADIYAWGLPLEVSLACSHAGDLTRARRINAQLLALPNLPAHVRACVERNLLWCARRSRQPASRTVA